MSLVEVLNPDSGTVTVGPPMLTPREGFALVASLDRRTLYAIGGEYPGATPRAESFDVATQTWSPLPSLPLSEGAAFGAMLPDGRVVAVFPNTLGPDGGARVEVLADGGWLPGPDLYQERAYGGSVPWLAPAYGAAAVGETIYAVDKQLSVQAWNTDLDAGTWNQAAQQQRFGLFRVDPSFVEGAGFLLVTGGLGTGSDCTDTEGGLLALDPTTLDAGWFGMASPPTTRDSATAAVSADSRLYVFGGESISSCCRGSVNVRSYIDFASYDVFDLDAGVWEPTHTQ